MLVTLAFPDQEQGEVHLWACSSNLQWYQHRPSDCPGVVENLGLADRELGRELERWREGR